MLQGYLLNKKKLFLYLLITEALLSGLFYINHYFIIIIPFLILTPLIFYHSFLVGPYFWILMMVFATGLDNYGRVFGGITLFHISYFLALISLVTYYSFNMGESFEFHTPINRYIYFYLIVGGISLTYTPNLAAGAILIIVVMVLFSVYLLIVNFLKTERQHIILLWVMLIANIANSLLTFYQIAFQNITYFGRGTVKSISGTKIWRAAGLFYDPNVGAVYMMVGTIVALAVVLYSNLSKFHKSLIFGAIILSTLGIIATFSRTGWIGLFIGFFVVALFHKKKIYLLYSLLAFILFFIGLSLFTSYGGFIINRFYSIFELMSDVSIRTRIGLGISGIKMFIDHPFFGIGLRGFPVLYDFYLSPITPSQLLYVKESHTLYIYILAELGIVGLAIIVFWFKQVVKDAFNAVNKIVNKNIKAIFIGNIGVFISFIIVYFFYGNIFPNFNMTWINLGIIYAIILNNTKME
jgi:O-antigen ligase